MLGVGGVFKLVDARVIALASSALSFLRKISAIMPRSCNCVSAGIFGSIDLPTLRAMSTVTAPRDL